MKQKESLLHRGNLWDIHIGNHYKTYIIGTIIIAMVALFSSIYTIMNTSWCVGYDEEKGLLIAHQIEEIAWQRDALIHKIGKEHFKIWEANFHKIDKQFSEEKDLINKVKLAQRLDSLMRRQHWIVELTEYTNEAEEAALQILEQKFDLLYNTNRTIPRAERSDSFIQQALSVFTQLQIIGEKRDKIIHILGKDDFKIWEQSYHQNASRFSITNDIREKYELSKEISNLLDRQNEYFKQQEYIGPQKYITDEEEKIYEETQTAFTKLN